MKTAIIGGGIGGMTTALLLANDGHEVVILEKENKLGGRLAFMEEGGFRIDQGPTIVLLPDMIESILAEAGLGRDQYEMIRLDPLYKITYPDGSDYTKHADIGEQEREISRKFPESLAGFQRFMKDMDYRFHMGRPQFLERPFLEKGDFWNKETLSSLARMNAHKSVDKQLSSYFKDERLRIAYALQTLYIGGNPLSTPAIYSLVSYSEHKHGIFYVKGGYASLIGKLEELLKEKGIEIRLGSRVEKLLTDGSEAKGAIINGQEEKYDSFILNGDFPVAEKELLDRRRNYKASSGCLLLYFGIGKVYEDAMVHQFFIGRDFNKSMEEIFKHQQLPENPSYYAFYPSAIDDSLAPEGKSVLYALIPAPSGEHIDWSSKDEYVDRIISRMEKDSFPGLRDHIEWMKVRTPEDALREGLYGGGSFGIAPSLFQSGIFRPQLRPFKEKNIYAVGASVHPGGGIPIVLQGAKMLADHVKHEHKKNPQTEGVSIVG
ncbi:phytoene desaturase family protein [Bacillus infantis]|uniref:phytoene desaturase family protein n=1 Tax=Bacillus infantis TaxID=324767 RepID=UPI003CEDF35E